MPRKLTDSVIAITGTSSGIGRATALEFARQNASLVLASRREAPLRDLAHEAERLGARAFAIPTDTRDEEAVERLAREAVSRFGRLDVWVNNAAVSAFGVIDEIPSDVFRNVIETNFFGYVHGIRAALPYFREQGGGVIINNSSVLGKIGTPRLSAYVSSKFAIRGLSESLLEELRSDGIYVCMVSPSSIDTPIFQNAANYTGRAVKPLEPIYDAELVAREIVKLAKKPRREAIVGSAGGALDGVRRLAPGSTSRVFARQTAEHHFQDRAEAPNPGTVLEPNSKYTDVSGGWKQGDGSGKRALALAGLAVLPAFLAWRRFRNGKLSLPISDGRRLDEAISHLEPVKERVTKTAEDQPWKKLWS